ncbi:MAG: GNAT family N-acetyltransferase [Bacteroidetes bacterium]|nr:GNAT family N-acetyltransferase [Bacteroidota bacterium]
MHVNQSGLDGNKKTANTRGSEFEITLIQDEDSLSHVKSSWDRLLDNSTVDNINLTYQWLSTAWKWFSKTNPSARLLVYCVYFEKRLIGVFPLMTRKTRYKRLFAVQQLCFLGFEYSDYSDIIVDRAFSEQIRRLFVQQVFHDCAVSWDLILLRNMAYLENHTDPFYGEVSAACFDSTISEKTRFYRIDFTGISHEVYWKNLSKSHRQNVRTASNRLNKYAAEAGLEIKWKRIAPEEAQVRACIRSSQDRQATKGRHSMVKEENFTNFVLDFVKSHSSLIRFHILTAGDETLAYSLDLKYKSTWYYWLPAFNANFDRFSPSVLLLDFVIRESVNEGCTKFDFMAGSSPYKEKWATGYRVGFQLKGINAQSVKARLLGRLTGKK